MDIFVTLVRLPYACKLYVIYTKNLLWTKKTSFSWNKRSRSWWEISRHKRKFFLAAYVCGGGGKVIPGLKCVCPTEPRSRGFFSKSLIHKCKIRHFLWFRRVSLRNFCYYLGNFPERKHVVIFTRRGLWIHTVESVEKKADVVFRLFWLDRYCLASLPEHLVRNCFKSNEGSIDFLYFKRYKNE